MNITRDLKPSFKRQYKKLSAEDQVKVKACMKDLVKSCEMASNQNSEALKTIVARRRIKAIQKLRKLKPTRKEATWDADGRIVWMYGSKTITFLFVGGHEVLDYKVKEYR